MTEHRQSFPALVWQFKWWWVTPLAVIAVMFAVLVAFSDLTADAPFIYSLF